jgi:hypothetical protein
MNKLIDAFRSFAYTPKRGGGEEESKVFVGSNREEKNFSLPNTEYVFHVYDPMLSVKQDFKKLEIINTAALMNRPLSVGFMFNIFFFLNILLFMRL